MSKSRIIPIEALRFLIMLQICLWHYNQCQNNMEAGYLGVEFFFILSGVFMYRTAFKDSDTGIMTFIFHRLKKFYFAYIVALILSYIVFLRGLIQPLFLENPFHEIMRFIGQMLLIQNVGIVQGGINNPLWFFSVLIYGGALVYSLTKYHMMFCIRVLFPVICILFFSYCFDFQNGIGLEQWHCIGPFAMPLVRGVVEMAYGVIVGYLIYNYNYYICRWQRLINILFVCSSIGYITIVLTDNIDAPYALVFLPMMINGALNSNWLQHHVNQGFWLKMGGVTFDMFIIHYILLFVIRSICERIGICAEIQIWIYGIMLIPSAMIFRYFTNCLYNYLKLYIHVDR